MKVLFIEEARYRGTDFMVQEQRALENTVKNRLWFLEGSWMGCLVEEDISTMDDKDVLALLDELEEDGELSPSQLDFILGKKASITEDYGGDWDDPIQTRITVKTFEKALDELWEKHHQEREEFFKLFDLEQQYGYE